MQVLVVRRRRCWSHDSLSVVEGRTRSHGHRPGQRSRLIQQPRQCRPGRSRTCLCLVVSACPWNDVALALSWGIRRSGFGPVWILHCGYGRWNFWRNVRLKGHSSILSKSPVSVPIPNLWSRKSPPRRVFPMMPMTAVCCILQTCRNFRFRGDQMRNTAKGRD